MNHAIPEVDRVTKDQASLARHDRMDQPRARRDLKESDKIMKNSLFYWFSIHTLLNYKLHQVCENQPLCNLVFGVVETTCIELVDKKVLTINLHQASWQLAADLSSSRRGKRYERILISA